MIELYPQIKLVHVAAVLASGLLFFVRGLGVQLGMTFPRAAPLRYLSYTIDTVLLAAALMLMAVLQQYPFVQSWLTVKILLVIAYIVVGSFAINRGRTKAARLLCWLGALAIYGFIITIARAHDPLGIFRTLMAG